MMEINNSPKKMPQVVHPVLKNKPDMDIKASVSPAQFVKRLEQQKGSGPKLSQSRKSAGRYPAKSPMVTISKVKARAAGANSRIPRTAAKVELSTETAAEKQQLQRQNSLPRLNFCKRKSISQMDFKEARRTGNFLAPKTPVRIVEIGASPRKLTDNSDHNALVRESQRNAAMKKCFNTDDCVYIVEDYDPQMAGLRIFSTIMLNAWRKRRDEVKQLTGEVESMKRGFLKAKTQLHVFNSLFRVEQRRNEDLQTQLKNCVSEKNELKTICRSLESDIANLTNEKTALEELIKTKDDESEVLNSDLIQVKSELFKALFTQRDLQYSLSEEQRTVQSLKDEKQSLINDIAQHTESFKDSEAKFYKDLENKQAELDAANVQIKELVKLKVEIIELNAVIQELSASDAKYKLQIESLRSQVINLQQCLASNLANRIKACWNSSMVYQKATFQMMHWVAYYMLPATPPPKYNFPFGLSMQKALSFVKR